MTVPFVGYNAPWIKIERDATEPSISEHYRLFIHRFDLMEQKLREADLLADRGQNGNVHWLPFAGALADLGRKAGLLAQRKREKIHELPYIGAFAYNVERTPYKTFVRSETHRFGGEYQILYADAAILADPSTYSDRLLCVPDDRSKLEGVLEELDSEGLVAPNLFASETALSPKSSGKVKWLYGLRMPGAVSLEEYLESMSTRNQDQVVLRA